MKHWFSDGTFRTIIRNSAYLGSSNVVSALLGLIALSCAGKGMTPATVSYTHLDVYKRQGVANMRCTFHRQFT